MERVWASPYRLSVLPVSLIHDSIYLLIKDDIEVVTWVNENLIDAMKWQELPELYHPNVKLGANLDIFYPTWANAITLPNHASKEDILRICKEGVDEYNKP